MKRTKKLICYICLFVSVMSLVGCGENPNEVGGTLIGAAAGGLLGSRFGGGSGKVAAGLAGAAIGGFVGNRVGQYMDRQDKINYRSAVVNTPVGQEARWTNRRTDTTYTVTPVKQYREHTAHHDRICRRYRTTVMVKGKETEAYGHVCKDKYDEWKIVS